MIEDLLPYYNRELAFLRRMGGEFARAHPKIAANLRISADNVDDPHVARLIESVALLNARIRYKLDDEFTEISEALLEVLYPHFLAPWPSMGIVRMQAKPDLSGVYRVPRGTEIDIAAAGGESCRYRTTSDADLWPVRVASALVQPAPFAAPASPRAEAATSVVKLVLEATNDDFAFGQARPDRLRFFLKGAPQLVHRLYEMLLNHAVLVAVSDGSSVGFAEPGSLQPGGMRGNDAVLPMQLASQPAYRLLSEYFAFPEKFMFVDLEGLDAAIPAGAGRRLEVFVYLERTDAELQRAVTADSFVLGCCPIVNLFDQQAEPIRVTHTTHDYRVIPDARRSHAMEVHAITKVEAIDRDGTRHAYQPFYSTSHTNPETAGYWFATRRPETQESVGREMRISLVDLDFNPDQPADMLLNLQTLCTNGDLPATIPYGGGLPQMGFVEGAAGVERLDCVTPLTPTRRPAFRHGARWRLVSHLSLNHMSLSLQDDSAEALREILKLYDVADSAETRALIEGIRSVRARPGTARFPREAGAPPWAAAICRGTDIEVTLDPARFSGSGMLLMGNLLDVFFGLYCAINSFTRLTVRVRGQTGILKRWPARAGALQLL